jgi:hypothetical protein
MSGRAMLRLPILTVAWMAVTVLKDYPLWATIVGMFFLFFVDRFLMGYSAASQDDPAEKELKKRKEKPGVVS